MPRLRKRSSAPLRPICSSQVPNFASGRHRGIACQAFMKVSWVKSMASSREPVIRRTNRNTRSWCRPTSSTNAGVSPSRARAARTASSIVNAGPPPAPAGTFPCLERAATGFVPGDLYQHRPAGGATLTHIKAGLGARAHNCIVTQTEVGLASYIAGGDMPRSTIQLWLAGLVGIALSACSGQMTVPAGAAAGEVPPQADSWLRGSVDERLETVAAQ